jgi:hypothetical protein
LNHISLGLVLKAETDGFVIIYILGLAGILSGLYLDWKMAVFGLFLIFSGVVIAFLDNNALLLAVGGTATLAVIVTAFVWIRYQQREESQAGSGTLRMASARCIPLRSESVRFIELVRFVVLMELDPG